MKSILLSICIALFSVGEADADDKTHSYTSGSELADGKVIGKIIDATNQQPVDYATVTIKSMEDTSFITGGLTADGGNFKVADLKPGKYEVIVSFMGYESISKSIEIDSKQKNIDLGSIALKPDSKSLSAVEVTAKKSDMMVGIVR